MSEAIIFIINVYVILLRNKMTVFELMTGGDMDNDIHVNQHRRAEPTG